jgi:hypothetical protein
MAMTFIARIELSSNGIQSMDFTSIPNTFTHLYIEHNIRSYRPGRLDPLLLRLNSDSSASYQYEVLYGWNTADVRSGGNLSSDSIFFGWVPCTGSLGNAFGAGKMFIQNYNNSSRPTYVTGENCAEDSVTNETSTTMTSGMWNNTNAITSITLKGGGSEGLGRYSSATLYGIN